MVNKVVYKKLNDDAENNTAVASAGSNKYINCWQLCLTLVEQSCPVYPVGQTQVMLLLLSFEARQSPPL